MVAVEDPELIVALLELSILFDVLDGLSFIADWFDSILAVGVR